MSKMASVVLAACLCVFGLIPSCFTARFQGPGPIIQTTYGQVQGKVQQLDQNTLVDVFSGIPHAQPPVGALRFKKPEPPLPWTGVRDVTSDRTACIQSVSPNGAESEDCLYLDVFSPHGINSSSNLAVVIYIHGGGYNHGSKNGNSAQLASNGVIVVKTNYRLGPIGFLSTEDDVIPGNYGMLDQISAMKWVQKNIAAFGGDPTRVTIYGNSAGSASVSHQVMSPLAKGLFARAIMASGVSTASRDVTPPKTAVTPKDMALTAGQALGCGHTPGQGFLTCMQSKNATDIIRECLKAAKSDSSSGHYRPRVETVFGFMPDYPLNLESRGEFNHVDMLRGFNAQELGGGIKDNENDGLTVAEFRVKAERSLKDFPYLDKDIYVQRIVDVYLANVTDPLVIRSRAADMVSDFTFISPIVLEAMNTNKNNQKHSYLYKFNYVPSFSKHPDWLGPTHGNEKVFVFGLGNRGNAADQHVSEMMVAMWTNFVNYGNPTPTRLTKPPLIHWEQCSNNNPAYLLIDSNLQLLTYDTEYDKNRLNLFRDTQGEFMKATNPGSGIVG